MDVEGLWVGGSAHGRRGNWGRSGIIGRAGGRVEAGGSIGAAMLE